MAFSQKTYSQHPFAAEIPRTKEASMLSSILPSAVQSRLPHLPSLRRSVSMYGLSKRGKSAHLPSVPVSRLDSGSTTPDGDCNNSMALSRVAACGQEDMNTTAFVESASASSEDDDIGIGTQKTKMKLEQVMGMKLSECKIGIEWKFANQGLSLLSLAFDESSSISQNSEFRNAAFARQLYIHAITYLLRALPPNLSTEERLSIRSSLSPSIVEPLRLEINPAYAPGTTQTSSPHPSLLHRVVAFTIVQTFVLFQFLLPYIKHIIGAIYQCDREYKISQKVMSQSIEAVDLVSKKGLTIGRAAWAMGNGRVGEAMSQTAAWCIEGVTGGIHEGVGEGMLICGVRRETI